MSVKKDSGQKIANINKITAYYRHHLQFTKAASSFGVLNEVPLTNI